MKKRWLFLPATIAILALGALMTGAAFAQEADTEAQSSIGKLASRVAQILGLDESEVNAAIQQARAELQDESTQARLDKMVEAGKMTQEQADEYMAWFESRPADGPGIGHRGFGGKKFGRFGRGGGRGHGGGFGGGFGSHQDLDGVAPAVGDSSL